MPHDLAPGVPATGCTLLTGPSNAGKSHRTAAALREWVARHGRGGVVVLDFAPEVWRDGDLLGGRLDRFPTPRVEWWGTLVAHAPRADSDSPSDALGLAERNAANARRLLAASPPPRAVFVNDATIALQADGAVDPLVDYCEAASVVVANAFDGEVGSPDTDAPGTGTDTDGATVSANERRALDALREWADREVPLDGQQRS